MTQAPTAHGWIQVFAPATVANVGPGYDCFGFAVEGLGDRVRARIVDRPGVHLVDVTGDGGALPREVLANTASRAAVSVWSIDALQQAGLELIVEKGLPLCSGLGSSAASAVAGALAAMLLRCEITGERFSPQAVLEAALDGEVLASGSRHADNVAPCLLGAFTVVQSNDPLRVVRLEPKLELHVALLSADIEISTRAAREILPAQVSLSDAVATWSNAAAVVAALCTGDAELLRVALTDRIVEPCRATLIPHHGACRDAALEAGALAFSISGSGPTLFALTLDAESAARTALAMAQICKARGLSCQHHVTRLSLDGARRL
ncbi:MAG: homoserine kinase [Pseudomonadota bacterium]